MLVSKIAKWLYFKVCLTTLCHLVFAVYPREHLPLSAYLSPLLRATPMSFSMPPASLRALVFSMFFVMTSCSAQQIAVMVSSDMVFPTRLLLLVPPPPLLVLLLLLPPGRRCTRSLMAYLPVTMEVNKVGKWGKQMEVEKGEEKKHNIIWTFVANCKMSNKKPVFL